ncbi:MAG: outer membrane protein assembly factor BamD [Chthoniobacterales bacterium]|nr:outer membrane protein assembly factor BamD [Chthoniobacterales bacterium]
MKFLPSSISLIIIVFFVNYNLYAQKIEPITGQQLTSAPTTSYTSTLLSLNKLSKLELRKLMKNRRGTPEAAAAALTLAKRLESQNNLERAFQAYNYYVKNYPNAPDFEEVIRRQISIANKLLEKKHPQILGITFGSGPEQAEKMFSEVLENAPFSKLAPIAQFNLGVSLEKQGKFEEAIKAYEVILERYPASSVVANALYQIGFVNFLLSSRKGSQDLSSLNEAKTTFQDFLLFFPESESSEQAKENLEKLSAKEASELYSIAQFYDRQKDYRSAFIYYNEVIRRCPSSKQASQAKTRIDELRATHGDDALRTGPEREQTSEIVALRRRLQAQTETTALPTYTGPPRSAIIKKQSLSPPHTRLRANINDILPLSPVETELPSQ